ncbi:MAG: hypothetical protein H7A25_03950 [Leptospiraceae bacterium]|nr:hypothetical protein [Leptospiraceae bacterium]MCP5499028.1 hypothetical protein [Leptospiraceae bacterium]
MKIHFVFLFLLLSFTIHCKNKDSSPSKAENGVIDLRNWNGEPIKVDGEWEFYPMEFIPLVGNGRDHSGRDPWGQRDMEPIDYGCYYLNPPDYWESKYLTSALHTSFG